MRIFRRQTAVIDCFKSIDQFRAYKNAQLRRVTRLAEQVKVGQGKILVREGQFGKESPVTSLGSWRPLTAGPAMPLVTALSDLDLLIIGRREFKAMLQISEFRDALLKSMASRLQTVDAQLATALDGHGGLDPDTTRVDWPSTSFASVPRPIVTETHYSEQF